MFIYFQQMSIFSPVVAFLLLISSALVLDAAIYFRRNERESETGHFFGICDKEPCGNVEAAGVSIIFIAVRGTVTNISSWQLKYHKYLCR